MKESKRKKKLGRLAVILAALLIAAPLLADEVLMTQGGLAFMLQQHMLPRQQRVEQMLARAESLSAEASALEDRILARIYLWPGTNRVEYLSPDGTPTGSADLDVPMQIRDGRTLVPLRFLGEALSATVRWEAETRQIEYTAPGLRIILVEGQKQVLVNDRPYEMDVAPTIIAGRTMVPVRFVSQWLGAVVRWDQGANRVEIRYLADPGLLAGATTAGDADTGIDNALG